MGVDGWNYFPISLDDVAKKMEWKVKHPGFFSRWNAKEDELDRDAKKINREKLQKLNMEILHG